MVLRIMSSACIPRLFATICMRFLVFEKADSADSHFGDMLPNPAKDLLSLPKTVNFRKTRFIASWTLRSGPFTKRSSSVLIKPTGGETISSPGVPSRDEPPGNEAEGYPAHIH